MAFQEAAQKVGITLADHSDLTPVKLIIEQIRKRAFSIRRGSFEYADLSAIAQGFADVVFDRFLNGGWDPRKVDELKWDESGYHIHYAYKHLRDAVKELSESSRIMAKLEEEAEKKAEAERRSQERKRAASKSHRPTPTRKAKAHR